MTEELLKIASEMERNACKPGEHMVSSGYTSEPGDCCIYREYAARIRACVSPEQVAFVEAARNHCSIANDDEILRDDVAAWYDRSHDKMMRAYCLMLAVQEKEKP